MASASSSGSVTVYENRLLFVRDTTFTEESGHSRHEAVG
jgi:hypothetical protein